MGIAGHATTTTLVSCVTQAPAGAGEITQLAPGRADAAPMTWWSFGSDAGVLELNSPAVELHMHVVDGARRRMVGG